MAFELKAEESLRKGLRRIARKQLDRALKELGSAPRDLRDDAVHEARKSLKKVRAVLCMVRRRIGKKTYWKENACFRDAARPLSEVRDAKILLEVLDKLAERFEDQIAGRTFGEVRKALHSNLRSTRKRILDETDAPGVVTKAIRTAWQRIKGWTDVPNKWASVGKGLAQTYRRNCDAFAEARAHPQVETLHEWRKQVKYLRHQLEILTPLWPERMEELVSEAKRMGELLGDDHDLAILRHLLTDDPERFGDPGDREVLVAVIDRRREELQRDAILLGTRFFQDKPKDFARRLRSYWKTWRAQE